MTSHSKELFTAITAAKEGAQEALRYYEKGIVSEKKKDDTIVTIADKNTEKVIMTRILSVFSDAKFVAEESGGDSNESSFWIVDPIDGTRCFSRGIPHWNILIALYKNSQIVLGVSYFPILDLLIYAEQGKGAFCNEKQMFVSSTDTMREAYVGFGSLRYFADPQVAIRLANASATVRSYDSAYMNYFVASGKMDGMADAYGNLWDIAPYVSIITEAGGKVTNLAGKPWTIKDRGFIATNGKVHTNIVDLVNE